MKFGSLPLRGRRRRQRRGIVAVALAVAATLTWAVGVAGCAGGKAEPVQESDGLDDISATLGDATDEGAPETSIDDLNTAGSPDLWAASDSDAEDGGVGGGIDAIPDGALAAVDVAVDAGTDLGAAPDVGPSTDASTSADIQFWDVGAASSALVVPALLPGKCPATYKGGPVGASCVAWVSPCIAVTYDPDGICRPKVTAGAKCTPPATLPWQATSTQGAPGCVSPTQGTCLANGRCAATILTGASCATGDPCKKGVCSAQGVCLSAVVPGIVCGETKNPCTAKRCDATGVCVVQSVMGGCETGDPCRPIGACAADGTCKGAVIPGLSCGESDNPCLVKQCSATGACVAAPLQGNACKPSSPCFVSGVCSAGGICEGKVSPGTKCDPPDNPCLGGTCDVAGTCQLKPKPGEPCGESTACAVRVCDPKGGCATKAVNLGKSCDYPASEFVDDGDLSCHVLENNFDLSAYLPTVMVKATCSAKGTCDAIQAQDGISCSPPFPLCRAGATCSAGKCVGGKPGGTCESLWDGDPYGHCTSNVCCTGTASDPDVCKGKKPGTCAPEPFKDGAYCAGDFAPDNGRCYEGECVYTPYYGSTNAEAKARYIKNGGKLPVCPACRWHVTKPAGNGTLPFPSCKEDLTPCAVVYGKYDLRDPCVGKNLGAYCQKTSSGLSCLKGKPDGTCCGPGLACKDWRCQQLTK